ncbi:MAG: hypothetical protein AB1762_20980 [Gemmatimonadota bacterium]
MSIRRIQAASVALRSALTATVVLLALAAPLATVSSQEPVSAPAVVAYQRSELAATGLAWICPGLGHLYAGERRRGETLLMLGSLQVVAAAWAMIDLVRGFCFDEDCPENPIWHAHAQGTLLGVGVGAWVFGVFDAHRAVRRQRRLKNGPLGHRDLELKVGLAPSTGTLRPSLAVWLTW